VKITFEIPDWAVPLIEDGRDVYLYAGIEPIARKLPGQPVETKINQCALCGKCCGTCPDLEERQGYKQPNGEWAMMCKWNEARPHSCSKGNGTKGECSIVWDTANTK